MGTFSYKARNRQGEAFEGVIEAANVREAAMEIRGRGLWVARLQELKEQEPKLAKLKAFLMKDIGPGKGQSREQALLFLRQLAVLLQSGLPVQVALRTLVAPKPEDSYQRMTAAIYRSLLQGQTLAQALGAYPYAFPESVRSLVHAGEEAGTLAEVLQQLADFLAESHESREKLKSLLVYPMVMGCMSLAAMVFMSVFILPTFAGLLRSLHAELPLPTALLLDFSEWLMGGWGLVLLPSGCILLLLAGMAVWHYQPCRLWLDRLLLRLPLIGSLYLHTDWQQMSGTLAVLTANGIPFAKAMQLVRNVPENHWLRDCLLRAQRQVEQGRTFTASVKTSFGSFCPRAVQELVLAGEQAGNLEEMLRQSAALCHVRASNTSARLQALADPVLTLVIGGVIFFVVLAMLLPLLDIIGTVG